MADVTKTVLDPVVGENRTSDHADTQHREIFGADNMAQGSGDLSGEAIAVDDTKFTNPTSSPSDVVETPISHDNDEESDTSRSKVSVTDDRGIYNGCSIQQLDRYVRTIVTSDLKNDSNQSSVTCLDAPSPASDIPSTSASQKTKRLVPISVVLSDNDIGKPAVTVWGESEKPRHSNVFEIFEQGDKSEAMCSVLNIIGNDRNNHTSTNQQGNRFVENKFPQAQSKNIDSPSNVYQSTDEICHNITLPATIVMIDDSNSEKPQDSLCEVDNAHESNIDFDDENSIIVDVVSLDVSSSPTAVETDSNKSSNVTKSSLLPSYFEHGFDEDKSLLPESKSDGSSDDQDKAVITNDPLPNIRNALEADRESDICVYSEESIYIMCTPCTHDDADSNASNILVISDNGKVEKDIATEEEYGAKNVAENYSCQVSETSKNVESSDETSKNAGLSSIIERLRSRSIEKKQQKAKKVKQTKIRKMSNSNSEDVPLSTFRKNLQSRRDKQNIKSHSASLDKDVFGETCKNKKGAFRRGKRKSHEHDSPSTSFNDQLTCSGDGPAKCKETESVLSTASTENDIVDLVNENSDPPLKKQSKLDTVRHTEDVMKRFQFISEQLNFLNKESGELETNIHKSSKEKWKSRSKHYSKNQTQRKGYKRKHLDADDAIADTSSDTTSSSDDNRMDGQLKIDEMPTVEDIDSILEENAEKNNLSTRNIRNILHHVVSNKHVLEMIQNTIRQQEGLDPSCEAAFLPKMTRSKVKEVLEKGNIPNPWPLTPIKKPKIHVPKFLEMSFSDSEGDDEYNPEKDVEARESDDDTDSILSSHLSEFGSPCFNPATPMSVSQSGYEITPDGKAESVQGSVCSPMGPPPTPITGGVKGMLGQMYKDAMAKADQETFPSSQTDDDIGGIEKRTRSKLPLKDTSLTELEALFVAPDITADMYETACNDEDWKNFLTDLVKSEDVCPTDEGEDANDPEYNYLEEAEEEEMDLEDFRNDKAVQISKRELGELMDEMLDAYSGSEMLDEDTYQTREAALICDRFLTQIAQPQLPRPAPEPVSTSPLMSATSPLMSDDERLQLSHHLRKHVQLLTQGYVLAGGNPEYSENTDTALHFLMELDAFSKLCPDREKSSFKVCNLDAALAICQTPITQSTPVWSKKYKNRGSLQLTELCENQKQIMVSSPVFLYPELLPECAYLPLNQQKSKTRVIFTEAEDNLLVLGLIQFRNFTDSSKYIHELLLPSKTVGQIKFRIKNLSAAGAMDNPIKTYKHTNIMPMFTVHNEPFDETSQYKAPQDQCKMWLVPPWCKKFLVKNRSHRTPEQPIVGTPLPVAYVTRFSKFSPKMKGTASPQATASSSSIPQVIRIQAPQSIENKQPFPPLSSGISNYPSLPHSMPIRLSTSPAMRPQFVVSSHTCQASAVQHPILYSVITGNQAPGSLGPLSSAILIDAQGSTTNDPQMNNKRNVSSGGSAIVTPLQNLSTVAGDEQTVVDIVVVSEAPSVTMGTSLLSTNTSAINAHPEPVSTPLLSSYQPSSFVPQSSPPVSKSKSLVSEEPVTLLSQSEFQGADIDNGAEVSPAPNSPVSDEKTLPLKPSDADEISADKIPVTNLATEQMAASRDDTILHTMSATSSPSIASPATPSDNNIRQVSSETEAIVSSTTNGQETVEIELEIDPPPCFNAVSPASTGPQRNALDIMASIAPYYHSPNAKGLHIEDPYSTPEKCTTSSIQESTPPAGNIISIPGNIISIPDNAPKGVLVKYSLNVSPFLEKSPQKRHQLLRRGAQKISPKGFTLTTYASPTKKAAARVTRQAKRRQMTKKMEISPKKHITPRKLLPKPMLVHLYNASVAGIAIEKQTSLLKVGAPVGHKGREQTESVYFHHDSDSDNSDKNDGVDDLDHSRKGFHSVRKLDLSSKPDVKCDSEDSDADDFTTYDSQNEDDDVPADSKDLMDELMAASTTIRFKPKKSLAGSKAQKRKEVNLAMLSPDLVDADPLRDDRDTAFAQAYLGKVRDCTKADPERYHKFLQQMFDFGNGEQSPVKLYHEVVGLLEGYPDLIHDFSGFLLPEQAAECGCFMSNLEFIRARSFLRKLEIYFEKHNSNFQRVMKAFSDWYSNPSRTQELRDLVQPMLRGNSHLLEEFSLFFPNERPAESYLSDFEDVSIGDSDDDSRIMDDFEEVDLPDEDDQYGTDHCRCNCHLTSQDPKFVRRIKHCKSCSLKVIDGRIYFQTSSKKLKPARVIYHRSQKVPGERTHTEITISDGKEVEETNGGKSEATGDNAQSQPEITEYNPRENGDVTRSAQDNRDVDVTDTVNEADRDLSANADARTSNMSDKLDVAGSDMMEKHDVDIGNENNKPDDVRSGESEKISPKQSPDMDNTLVNPVHITIPLHRKGRGGFVNLNAIHDKLRRDNCSSPVDSMVSKYQITSDMKSVLSDKQPDVEPTSELDQGNDSKESEHVSLEISSPEVCSVSSTMCSDILAKAFRVAQINPDSFTSPIKQPPTSTDAWNSASTGSNSRGAAHIFLVDRPFSVVNEHSTSDETLPDNVIEEEKGDNCSEPRSPGQADAISEEWTEESDRMILERCRTHGANPETFKAIAEELYGKSEDQVSRRCQVLLELLMESDSTTDFEDNEMEAD